MADMVYDQDGNTYESHAHWIADKPITPDAPSEMTSANKPSIFDQAKEQYPILKDLGYGYKESFGKGQGFLEHWPANEPGNAEHPRPKEFSIESKGLEVYDKNTRPIDIMGDVASHELINSDPTVKGVFEDFKSSLQPWQKDILKNQYEHARSNLNEKRSYADWESSSGLPAYFRGYAFQQWDGPDRMYTPEQMKKFDSMMEYLKQPSKASDSGLLDMPENQSFVKAADFIGSLAPNGIKPEGMTKSTNVEDHRASSLRFQDLHQALGDYMKANEDWLKNPEGPKPDINSFMTPDDLSEYSTMSSKALFGQTGPGYYDGSSQNSQLAKDAGIDQIP